VIEVWFEQMGEGLGSQDGTEAESGDHDDEADPSEQQEAHAKDCDIWAQPLGWGVGMWEAGKLRSLAGWLRAGVVEPVQRTDREARLVAALGDAVRSGNRKLAGLCRRALAGDLVAEAEVMKLLHKVEIDNDPRVVGLGDGNKKVAEMNRVNELAGKLRKLAGALEAGEVAKGAGAASEVYVERLDNQVGGWVPVSSDEEELLDGIMTTLGVQDGQDFEYRVSDYVEFPVMGDHPALGDLARVGGLIDQHGSGAVVAAVDITGVQYLDDVEELLDGGFREYEGGSEADALSSYAEDMASEGVLGPDHLLKYVDFERVGRDLELGGGVQVGKSGEKIFIFGS
jgi:antirestriction protein